MSNPSSRKKQPHPKEQKDKRVQLFEDELGRVLRRMIPPGRGVLLAVSGGPDSMAMLAGVAAVRGRLGLEVEAATVDHQLRPESAAEVQLVARQAQELQVRHHGLDAPIRVGSGVEAAARQARYAALSQLAKMRGLDLTATAHTANDQAETLLMRLARGTSLAGAAGIHSVRADGVIRPLLFATRAQVEAYALARRLEVARDAMNLDPKFLRVKMREQVLPALVDAAGPGTTQALARFAALASDDEAWLHAEGERALSQSLNQGAVDAALLSSLPAPIARRAVARWLSLNALEVSLVLVEEVRAALRDGRGAPLPQNRVLACSNGWGRIVLAPARRTSGIILTARTEGDCVTFQNQEVPPKGKVTKP